MEQADRASVQTHCVNVPCTSLLSAKPIVLHFVYRRNSDSAAATGNIIINNKVISQWAVSLRTVLFLGRGSRIGYWIRRCRVPVCCFSNHSANRLAAICRGLEVSTPKSPLSAKRPG